VVLVTVGVDTHVDVHVAVALDQLGRRLGSLTFPTSPAGYAQLVAWVGRLGTLERVGVEGAGSFGAGLTRWLRVQGMMVLEVSRPNRQLRRHVGKSDQIDAEAAARAVQSGVALGRPKTTDGQVEMVRAVRVARSSAVKARTQAANQLHALVITAPDPLRGELRGLGLARLVARAARFRPGPSPQTPTAATKLALRSIAVRYQHLSAEITELDRQLQRLVATAAPGLLALKGVGPDIAAALMLAAGDNPQRLRSEAAFARLCGVAPLPASSGRTSRHRLSRGGNRDANRALYMLAVSRLRWDPRTRAYVDRRTREGKTTPEIIRCLKRHLARETYRALTIAAPVSRQPAAHISPRRDEPHRQGLGEALEAERLGDPN
jgi:transposase